MLDCLLWSGVGIIAALLVGDNLTESYCRGFSVDRVGLAVGLAVGAVLALLTCLGICLRWGAIIPSVLLGMFGSILLPSSYAHSEEEAVFQDLGVPLVGAVCGLVFAVVVGLARRKPEAAKSSDA
jgi:hypothetical protein